MVLGTWRVIGIPTAPRGGMVSPATSTVVHWQVGTAAAMVIGVFVGLINLTSTSSFEPACIHLLLNSGICEQGSTSPEDEQRIRLVPTDLAG